MIHGLATVVYSVSDLGRARAWYAEAFQQEPYFTEPFYVGFNIRGYELGLDPNPSVGRSGGGGGVAYWRVDKIDGAVQHFVHVGATIEAAVQAVGDGVKVATVRDPFGNVVGLIENPHFKLPD